LHGGDLVFIFTLDGCGNWPCLSGQHGIQTMHLQPQNRVAHFVRLALKGGVVATCLAFGSAAQAGIAFQFNFSGAFTDGANNDAAQQGAMVTAGNLFSNMFGNYFSNSGTIVLNASGSDDPLSNTLASASSAVVDSGAAGLVGSVVRDKLLTGIDKNGATADGSVDVNFGAAWQLDPNALVLGSEFDFYAAVFHELTHALGFASTIDPVPGGNPYFPNQWSAYDTFLRDKDFLVFSPSAYNAVGLGTTQLYNRTLVYDLTNPTAAPKQYIYPVDNNNVFASHEHSRQNRISS